MQQLELFENNLPEIDDDMYKKHIQALRKYTIVNLGKLAINGNIPAARLFLEHTKEQDSGGLNNIFFDKTINVIIE